MPRRLLLHGVGATWTPQTDVAIDGAVQGISGAAGDDVWAVGEAGVQVRFDGTTWQSYGTGTDATLRAVHGASAKQVWMVGADGTILYWDGSALVRETAAPVGTLYGVFATADGQTFAVGDTGTVLKRLQGAAL